MLRPPRSQPLARPGPLGRLTNALLAHLQTTRPATRAERAAGLAATTRAGRVATEVRAAVCIAAGVCRDWRRGCKRTGRQRALAHAGCPPPHPDRGRHRDRALGPCPLPAGPGHHRNEQRTGCSLPQTCPLLAAGEPVCPRAIETSSCTQLGCTRVASQEHFLSKSSNFTCRARNLRLLARSGVAPPALPLPLFRPPRSSWLVSTSPARCLQQTGLLC